jgi:hypothetical protein
MKTALELLAVYVHGLSMAHKHKREALEARVAELESKSVSWEGTWQSGKVYAKQALVQDHGAVWIACARPRVARLPAIGS